jgi:hypothetical protein
MRPALTFEYEDDDDEHEDEKFASFARGLSSPRALNAKRQIPSRFPPKEV